MRKAVKYSDGIFERLTDSFVIFTASYSFGRRVITRRNIKVALIMIEMIVMIRFFLFFILDS